MESQLQVECLERNGGSRKPMASLPSPRPSADFVSIPSATAARRSLRTMTVQPDVDDHAVGVDHPGVVLTRESDRTQAKAPSIVINGASRLTPYTAHVFPGSLPSSKRALRVPFSGRPQDHAGAGENRHDLLHRRLVLRHQTLRRTCSASGRTTAPRSLPWCVHYAGCRPDARRSCPWWRHLPRRRASLR